MSAQPTTESTRAHVILQRIAVLVLALGLVVGTALPFAGPAQAAEDQRMYENKSDLKGGRLT